MKSHERLWTTLAHEEPDRVPTFVQHIESPFIRTFDEQVEVTEDYGFPLAHFDLMVAKALGFDSKWIHASRVVAPPDLPETPPVPEEHRVTRHGHVNRLNPADNSAWYVDGILKTPELIRAWIDYIHEFTVADEAYYRGFAREVWDVGCAVDMVPIPTAGGPIYTAWASIGMDRLALLMRKHPKEVADLFMAWGELTKEEHACFFEQGVDMIWTCDDHAFKDRLMFSPRQYDRFIYPVYKMLADHAHKHGAKFFVHTDGNTSEAFPGMIRAGVDATDPLEYEANMRLGPLKEQYGDDITLVGNVPATYALSVGNVEDTIRYTRECLAAAMAGGGYVLAPGSDLLGTAKLENVQAMIHAAHKYGRYE